MKELFELEWMGGAAEHHFRKARPAVDDMPWGTLDVSSYPPAVVAAACAMWTRASITEYRAVVAFSEVLRTMTEARAPLDIIGMASSFVADEVVHVELTSRMAMEVGGAEPGRIDLDQLFPSVDRSLTAFQRANEAVVRVSCVAEAFSGKMVAASFKSTTHPLTQAVLGRIAADESLHYRLGWIYLDWAKDRLDDAERARLAAIATRGLEAYATTSPADEAPVDPAARGRRDASDEQARAIGWLEKDTYRAHVREAVRRGITLPLASYGIEVPATALVSMFGEA